ncbi:uncharacterized protein MONOS_3077 [Monocercomonoides exilis]|uniref:uncharacterized protein n=1 Tax=Monocercomonoides exilis TaxID=2049356 RepID=UPI00355A4A3D|nr:hypothetical protein MONOS_3077 [Monocercomonoides exilis]|eukprot:MONOS_3077.1-p1 / transcript=MONOS_3077.1 / gene=MONOS_3077 / organism=Monocercomonoides_exilis_PA203 / gene_product=unspecified product / transcript_product=unspecified product / location=Mono_scaffold00069:24791-25195(+) / protein_length=135 / sequence_SO=supercontig / SO=protein_coding / is_pseudo=false
MARNRTLLHPSACHSRMKQNNSLSVPQQHPKAVRHFHLIPHPPHPHQLHQQPHHPEQSSPPSFFPTTDYAAFTHSFSPVPADSPESTHSGRTAQTSAAQGAISPTQRLHCSIKVIETLVYRLKQACLAVAGIAR